MTPCLCDLAVRSQVSQSALDVEHDDSLATYRAKRSPDSSPEPVGTVSPIPGRLFVVHKHAASHLHFDLRIEMDGVLHSWAVPKGPSYDMDDKRLAVRVEDHPLEYGDFEGIIPTGNYGAGGIIVWDRGEWVPLEDWREGLEKGKLLFELKGYKLHGKWTLVKIKKSEKDWLLIKERDAYVKSPGDVFDETSVLSGLTVEEVKAGQTHASTVRKALQEAGRAAQRASIRRPRRSHARRAGGRRVHARRLAVRAQARRLSAARGKRGDDVLLLTRNGNDYTEVFPEIARAVKALPLDACILDGEVVVLDAGGHAELLAAAAARADLVTARHRAAPRSSCRRPSSPSTCSSFEDFDLRPLPLARRKQLLAELVPKLGAVRGLDHIEREGERVPEQVTKLGLEGIIAKKADAPYRGGRTDKWLKIKAERTGDFVIVGFTQPKGTRAGFGALQLAEFVERRARATSAASAPGSTTDCCASSRAMLDPLVRRDPPCHGPALKPGAEPLPSERDPGDEDDDVGRARVRVRGAFREWTPDGLLRHSAFLRLRDDKRPDECERQGWRRWRRPRRRERRQPSDSITAPAAVAEPPVPEAPRSPEAAAEDHQHSPT